MRILTILSKILPKKSISRDAILIVIGDAILFLSNTVAAMILARLISIDDMATYRQVVYLGPLALTIVDFGFSSSIYRFWNLLNAREQSTYLKLQLLLSIVLSTIATLLLAILAPYLARWYNNPDLKYALLICSVYPIVNIIPNLVRPVLINKGRPLWATSFQTIIAIISVVSLIIPYFLGAGFLVALSSWMIGSSLGVISTVIILRQYFFTDTPWWDRKMFIACWNYLWPQEVASLPGIFTLYIDKIITSVLLTKDAFAAYSLGSRELPFVGQIGGSVSNVLMPHLVKDMKENNDDEVSRRWSRSCEKSAIITYPIAGFSIWFALPIIQFLFSSRYNESSIPFAIFSAITFIRVIEFGSLAKVYGKTNIIMKSSFWSAGTMLILAFPMTYFFKVRGISFSVFLSVLVAAGYFLWEYKKFLKKPVSDFFPWKKLLIMAGASITSAVLAGLILGRVLNLAATTGILVLGLKLIALFVTQLVFYLAFLQLFRIVDLRAFYAQFKNIA